MKQLADHVNGGSCHSVGVPFVSAPVAPGISKRLQRQVSVDIVDIFLSMLGLYTYISIFSRYLQSTGYRTLALIGSHGFPRERWG